jgi:dolichol-phosphate mannosyltransferase
MKKKTENLVSIIVPCFNEEEVIVKFYNELCSVLNDIDKYNFEIIFINDGSIDKTKEIINNLILNDERIALINFSRNFGHQNALTCGIDYASGDAIISLDSDLQHPPRLIKSLIKKYEEGNDIVYTVRKDNHNIGRFKKFSSKLFYKIFNKLSNLSIEANTPDYRLISKKVQLVFKNNLREYSRFLRGLFSWVGFKSTFIEFEVEKRAAGVTKYKLKNMLRFSRDGITSFSEFPLKIGLWLGLFATIVLCLYGLFVLAQYFIYGDTISGWTSLALLISFIGAIQFILIGIIGAYIGYVFAEKKSRPLYIIDTIDKKN